MNFWRKTFFYSLATMLSSLSTAAMALSLATSASSASSTPHCQRGPMPIFGHRGAMELAPENTLASFSLAYQLGASGNETDIFLTKDRQIILLHDETLARVGRYNPLLTHLSAKRIEKIMHTPVGQLTYAEIAQVDVGLFKGEGYRGEKVPLLSQALAQLPRGKTLVIELKDSHPRLIEHLALELQKVRRHKYIDPQHLILISFDIVQLGLAHRRMPQYRALWITQNQLSPLQATAQHMHDIQKVLDYDLDGINFMAHPNLTSEVLENMRRHHLFSMAWVLGNPESPSQENDLFELAQLLERRGLHIFLSNFGWKQLRCPLYF